MKIYIPNIANTSIGGGWTFLRNFQKSTNYIEELEVTQDPEDYDILFAFAPTTIDGETIQKAKRAGKPFVLRMDGVPEDSRNSGRGSRRMVEYAKEANFIVYQTGFVQRTVGRMLHDLGVTSPNKVIHNGVDTEVFTNEGGKLPLEGDFKILHVNYRKDNNKRVEEVIQMYRELWTDRKDTNLLLMGRYPTEWESYGMGFFAGERYKRLGVVTDDNFKSMVMRSCDVLFYPSYADPAPNVVLEAMACGLPIFYQGYGGVLEMVHPEGGALITGDYINTMQFIERNAKSMGVKNLTRVQEKFTLQEMGMKYLDLFKFITNNL